MRKLIGTFALVLMALGLLVAPASAYTFDSATGHGFVGKGEVQTALGINNAGIQNGTFVFNHEVISETTWTCSRINPQGKEIVQERETKATTQGLVSSTARERNQITGFNLTGLGSLTTTTDGPAVGSCPSGLGAGWTFDEGSIDTNIISSTLYVNDVAL